MKHRDVGTHEPRHEAAWLTGTYWGQKRWAAAQAKGNRPVRRTVWAADRPIPLGVVEEAQS